MRVELLNFMRLTLQGNCKPLVTTGIIKDVLVSLALSLQIQHLKVLIVQCIVTIVISTHEI